MFTSLVSSVRSLFGRGGVPAANAEPIKIDATLIRPLHHAEAIVESERPEAGFDAAPDDADGVVSARPIPPPTYSELPRSVPNPTPPPMPAHIGVSRTTLAPEPPEPQTDDPEAWAGHWSEVLSLSLSQLDADAAEAGTPDYGEVMRQLTSIWEGELPKLPNGAASALQAAQDPNTDLLTLVELVEGDPSLAQLLLKTSNSALYLRSRPCASIHDAIVLMGRKAVGSVVMRYAVSGVLCSPGVSYAPMLDRVWQHLVECGDLARQLAPAVGAQVDEAYTHGLLHDVGKLLVFEAIARARRELGRDVELPERLVSELMRITHAELGALAILSWGVGLDFAKQVADHHRLPDDGSRDTLREVVFLADKLQLADARGYSVQLPGLFDSARIQASVPAVELAVERWRSAS